MLGMDRVESELLERSGPSVLFVSLSSTNYFLASRLE